MNFQESPNENLSKFIESVLWSVNECEHFCYPLTFPSTAGPRHGIGGQALTTFTVHAWSSVDVNKTLYVCAGMYKLEDGYFELFHAPKHWLTIPEVNYNARNTD